jgi:hypothetical protein
MIGDVSSGALACFEFPAMAYSRRGFTGRRAGGHSMTFALGTRLGPYEIVRPIKGLPAHVRADAP